MFRNPYKYKGPLDPEKDKLVCVTRQDDVNRVIQGIIEGEYWAVLGPRQIGKTTFLRQIQHTFPNAHYIYFDLEISHSNEKEFYMWTINQFLKIIPSEQIEPLLGGWDGDSPGLKFFDFLNRFKPKDNIKKITLMFDEIDSLPYLRNFLHIWRKVFHERYDQKQLNKYAVIITGSVDLIPLTVGPTSPFNIAETLYLKDLSNEESENLINDPLKNLNISIEPKAKEKLISQISGHPQLLQHACHRLVENAKKSNPIITEQQVNEVIDVLFKINSSLDTLKQDLIIHDILQELVKEILKGKNKKYFPYKEFSMLGAGAIVERNSHCRIRNKVYEEFIRIMLENPKILYKR